MESLTRKEIKKAKNKPRLSFSLTLALQSYSLKEKSHRVTVDKKTLKTARARYGEKNLITELVLRQESNKGNQKDETITDINKKNRVNICKKNTAKKKGIYMPNPVTVLQEIYEGCKRDERKKRGKLIKKEVNGGRRRSLALSPETTSGVRASALSNLLAVVNAEPSNDANVADALGRPQT